MQNKLILTITNTLQKTCNIKVNEDATCADVKVMAYYALKYPNFKELIEDDQYYSFFPPNIANHFRLIYNGKELEDEETLGSNNVKNNSKLSIVSRMGRAREITYVVCVADNLTATINLEHTCADVQELKLVLSKLFSIPCTNLYFRRNCKYGSEKTEFSKLEDNALCIPFIVIYAKFSGEMNSQIQKGDSCRGLFEKLSDVSVKVVEETTAIKLGFINVVDTIKLPTNNTILEPNPLKTSFKPFALTGAFAGLFSAMANSCLFNKTNVESAFNSSTMMFVKDLMPKIILATTIGALFGFGSSYVFNYLQSSNNTCRETER